MTASLIYLAVATAFPAAATTFAVLNKNDSGAGSLRQAIQDANDNPGADLIAFNIGGAAPYDIDLESALPEIIDVVTIDGTTQPGFGAQPLVMLAGAAAGSTVTGLKVKLTTGCTIRGLIINGFRLHGIELDRGGNHTIVGNFIGTGSSGTSSQGNRLAGIHISDSANNIIGGLTVAERNLVSGNQSGIHIEGTEATNNVVLGNFIGTDVDGTAEVGNTNNGVILQSASRNIIGGAAAGARNIISGNNQSGVYLLGANTTGNQVCGNFIGTTVWGTNSLANKTNGIFIYQAAGNLIGGSLAGQGNVISGNKERGTFLLQAAFNRIEGNLIGLAPNGVTVLGNSSSGIGFSGSFSNVVGGTNASARNVISGNQESGIAFADALCVGNVVEGNYIGTTAVGTIAAPNALSGVVVSQGSNNVVAANLISGNAQSGVYLQGGTTLLARNRIGADATGRLSVRNGFNGIRIDSAGNTIGGHRLFSGNMISGHNSGLGVLLFGVGASNNVISGNLIGVAAEGTNALGNSSGGIWITNAPRNLIGGKGPFEGNVISGNGNSGILLTSAGATGNQIQGNLIGTDISGTRAIANVFGGIYFSSAPTNYIGGVDVGSGNVISGNSTVAISIGDAGANGNVIQGNYIGLQKDGNSALGNEQHGIDLFPTVSGTIVGGTQAGAGNRIAYARTAGYDGVRVRDAAANNVIRGNSVFQNGAASINGLAIDLSTDSVTLNDGNDGDTGANLQQNFPVLTSASGRYRTAIEGTLNSRPNSTFTIDFYGNSYSEANGYGEGERWLGAVNVTSGGGGNASFSAVLTNFFGAGPFLSATATDAAGNTSEFSTAVPINAGPDTDGDGMPDDYELIAGLNPNFAGDAGFDLDNDGATNRNEFVAGTDASHAFSVLNMELLITGNTVTISFPGVLGKTYRVEAANDVLGPWTTLADTLAGTGATLRLAEVTENTNTRFYRVHVTSN